MSFDFAAAKANARRVVNTTLGVQAFYQDASLNAPIETRARWHNRIERFGDDESQGNAEIVEGIERIILIPEQWMPDPTTGEPYNTGVPLALVRGGTMHFPHIETTFKLDHREPHDGPLEQAWQVTRV